MQLNVDEGTPDGSVKVPPYLSFSGPGADVLSISDEMQTWGVIDDPNFVGTANEGDDTGSGILSSESGPMGSFQELAVFSIDGLAADQTVRVGILSGNHTNFAQTAVFDPIALRLSDRNNPGNSQTVGSTVNPDNFLEDNPGGVQAGWVFFDITANGDYAISAAVRVDNMFGFFTSIGGITFDSVIGSPFLLGDINGDGVVNFLDITPFIALITTGEDQAEADINGDGNVNFLDITPFIALLTAN